MVENGMPSRGLRCLVMAQEENWRQRSPQLIFGESCQDDGSCHSIGVEHEMDDVTKGV